MIFSLLAWVMPLFSTNLFNKCKRRTNIAVLNKQSVEDEAQYKIMTLVIPQVLFHSSHLYLCERPVFQRFNLKTILLQFALLSKTSY